MELIGVYVITHKVTGKFYIGQTIHLKKRLQQHACLLRAGTHSAKELQSCHDSSDEFYLNCIPCVNQDEAKELEETMIRLVGMSKLCTNTLLSGRPMSDVTKAKIAIKSSLGNLGKPKPESMRIAIAAYRTGRKQPQHVKDAVSRANKGRTHIRDATYRATISKALSQRVEIDKVVYDSGTLAAKALGLVLSTVMKRCRSTDPRYIDWILHGKQV